MNAYKMTTNIPKNRTILLKVPTEIPPGPVEIIMIYGEESRMKTVDIIEKTCGSLAGSKLTTERFSRLKQEERELER